MPSTASPATVSVWPFRSMTVPGERTVAADPPAVQSAFSVSVTTPLSAPKVKLSDVNAISSSPLTETVNGTFMSPNSYSAP